MMGLLKNSPKVAVAKLVNSLKGVFSGLIRKNNYSSITKHLWDGALLVIQLFFRILWWRPNCDCKAIVSIYRTVRNSESLCERLTSRT